MDFDGLREAKARENTSARDSQGNLKCIYIRRVCDDWQYIFLIRAIVIGDFFPSRQSELLQALCMHSCTCEISRDRRRPRPRC